MASVYTVKQINSYIQYMFTQDFVLARVCVKGEVSNLKYHTSGHIYFSLKDESGVLACVMFARDRKGLNFRMENGQSVSVSGSIRVYERDGKYQLYAREIVSDGGGDLYRQFEERKAKLAEIGLFEDIYKKPIPKYATKIGIVTAATGAAIQDICNIAARRNPYVELYLYNALVQGEGAAASVAKGIRALDAMHLDVLIVGRGGGSAEDLWAFNEEEVAYAIFGCGTPVISAVGHETDVTIADFVADRRAPTPSAAAELAVFEYEKFAERLAEAERKLSAGLRRSVNLSRARADALGARLAARNPAHQLAARRQYLDTLAARLGALSPIYIIRERRQQLDTLRMRLMGVSPQYQIDVRTQQLDVLAEEFEDRIREMISEKRQRLLLDAQKLDDLSPLKRLSQGYVFAEDRDGKPVGSTLALAPEDELKIYFKDGTALARVEEVDVYSEDKL
ncbi:MAG: exodeoxyribonuclease VII large subunit [Lachnospiraceae bacterium]|nr:exodeoxyribonuclease VII large subunit [Lachnospiraceae bacterium]